MTNWINSLLDTRLVDPGSSLIYVGAYGPKCTIIAIYTVQLLRNTVAESVVYTITHLDTDKNCVPFAKHVFINLERI